MQNRVCVYPEINKATYTSTDRTNVRRNVHILDDVENYDDDERRISLL